MLANLLLGLKILGLGMLAIFIVMTVIFCTIKILNVTTSRIKARKDLRAKLKEAEELAKLASEQDAVEENE